MVPGHTRGRAREPSGALRANGAAAQELLVLSRRGLVLCAPKACCRGVVFRWCSRIGTRAGLSEKKRPGAMITPYHSQYYAYELTRRWSSDRMEKLSQSLFNATVDLNPHQLDAALFAFRSPLSRGAILADEVGLGKTIEAGLIISQLWAERKRRILCILPAALRKQWNRELIEKFFIDSIILESGNFGQLKDSGARNPFEQQDGIVLCSYQFARMKEFEVASVPWDLVVVDEAHRLRNVYKKGNKIARAIRTAIEARPKVLLTATPLQNSLMELFGLVSVIDPHIFGNEDSFREQFAKQASDMSRSEYEELRARIRPICLRTLRRQVAEYIRYTNRVSITQDFTPTDDELRLYDAVSAYLQRPSSYALPSSQRSLMTLVLRKILASSSFAIAGTLRKLVDRLETMTRDQDTGDDDAALCTIAEDFEALAEVSDESLADANGTHGLSPTGPVPSTRAKDAAEMAAILKEVEELRCYKTLAESITTNAKGEALLVALRAGLAKAAELGAPQKALIFTESRRTQRYLKELLEANGYAGQTVLLSGTNADPDSRRVYRSWLERHRGEDTVTGSATSDMRSALVEEFEDRAPIMIATESGAEGINLQFCSLVVNYDLPWNPQRIEQRIGRCHRYGQKFDVVVINFLNRKNAADQRVFQLLREKFQLFDGVFGASDEVLGALESGVDFEKRVNEIYQSCRTEAEIQTAFDRLQAELDQQIQATMQETRSKLLEHFDEDVHARLRGGRERAAEQIDRFAKWLWQLTEHELGDAAVFEPNGFSFDLRRQPKGVAGGAFPLGRYRLVIDKDSAGEHHYRLGHPLAEALVARAKQAVLPTREVTFRYDLHPTKVSVLEAIRGRSGWLQTALLTIGALETEEHLLLAAVTDDSADVDAEVAAKFFTVGAETGPEVTVPQEIPGRLIEQLEAAKGRIVADTSVRNQRYFDAEMEKLDAWAEDLKDDLEREIKELDKEIKALKREAHQTGALEPKLELHRRVKDLERRRNEKRRTLFEAQDKVDAKKEALISQVEARLVQRCGLRVLFAVRWKVE